RNAEKHAGERRTGSRTDLTEDSELEQKDQRNPYGAVDHLRPIRIGEIARHGKRDAAGEGCRAAAPLVAAKEVSEQRAHEVDQHVIPVEGSQVEMALGVERH